MAAEIIMMWQFEVGIVYSIALCFLLDSNDV